MSAIFISHSSDDNEAAGEIKVRLADQGHRSVFLDFDPEDGIPAGRDWERELYARLRGCQAVVVLCSQRSMASHWCFAEIALARSLGKTLLPLKIGDCAIPAAFTDVQLIDIRVDHERGYKRLWAALRQAGLDPAEMFDWDGSRPPYPGLMVFKEQDAAVYFGRRAEIQSTIEKLNRMQRLGDAQLAMVLGASGSGKSSLLRAGVMPRLKRDRDRWLMLGPIRPLGQPFERLATVLSAAFKSCGADRPWQEIRDRLAQPAADAAATYLVDLANDLRVAADQREATLLLGVDQFEELLPPGEGAIESHFLKLLRVLVEARSGSVVVIGTLRSDFLGNFQNHAALRGLSYEPIDLPQLSVEAFAEVIEAPARLAGLDLEPGLAGAIVADAGTDDALPLLAFAMRELWEARGADGRLTIDRYRNGLGGLQGSVAKAADALYPKLFAEPADERDLRNAFLAMVRVDSGGAYVRKPARWSELPRSAHGLLERFVQGRLLVSRGEGTGRMLEVAHEALIRRWDKLRSWVEEDREFLRTRERIEAAAARWLEAGREGSLLLPRGRPLAEAQEIWAARRTELAPDIVALIEASIAAKRVQDEEEQLIQQQLVAAAQERELAARRLARQTLLAALGVGVLAVVAVGAGLFAVKAADDARKDRDFADEQRQLADAQHRLATARQLATEARVAFDRSEGSGEGLRNSLLLAAHSLSFAWTPEGFEAWLKAMQIFPQRPSVILRSEDGGPFVAATFSPDGGRLAVAGSESIFLLDGKTMEVLAKLPQRSQDLAFSPPDGRFLAAAEYNKVVIWDVPAQRPVHEWRPPDEPYEKVRSLAFDANASRLAFAQDYSARVIETEGWTEIAKVGVPPTFSVAFFPSQGWLLTGGEFLSGWNPSASSDPVFSTSSSPPRLAGALRFSKDGRWVATSADIYRVETAPDGSPNGLTNTAPLSYESDPTGAVAFASDGDLVANTSDDHTVRIHEVKDDGLREVIRLPDDGEGSLSAVTFSPVGGGLITGGDELKRWPLTRGADSVRLENTAPVGSMLVDRDGRYIIAVTDDGLLHVWNTSDWKEIFKTAIRETAGHQEASQVALSSNGRWLAATSGNVMKIVSVGDWRELATSRYEADISSVVFASNDHWVIGVAADHVLAMETAAWRAQDLPHENNVEAVTISPDGTWLASISPKNCHSSIPGMTRVWQLANGRQGASLSHNCNSEATGTGRIDLAREASSWTPVTAQPGLTSPDGSLTFGLDNGFLTLATPNGSHPIVLDEDDNVVGTAFTPDGRWLITASRDGIVRVWALRSADLIAETCSRVTRNLPESEWRRLLGDEPYAPLCKG